jgi:hypothetical protein
MIVQSRNPNNNKLGKKFESHGLRIVHGDRVYRIWSEESGALSFRIQDENGNDLSTDITSRGITSISARLHNSRRRKK